MKRLFLLLILASCPFLCVSAQNEKLSNQSILDMIELGFSDDIIMTKIKTSESCFDTSIDALKILKEKGVSDSIIVALMNGQSTQSTESTKMESDRIGIYYNGGNSLAKIYPSVFSGTKTNTLGAALSYGLASATIKVTLNRPNSNNVVTHDLPEFIFYFPKNTNDLVTMGANWWFFSATSPNEFALVRLDAKDTKRELKTGSVNIYSGTDIGVDENSIIPFDIINVDDRTFKVVPQVPLLRGEYCFFYQGNIPTGGYSNQSVFDFSVQVEDVSSKFNIGNTAWTLIKGKPKHCDIYEVERKKDGFYYTLSPFMSNKTIKIHESKCFSSKQELFDSGLLKHE